MHYTEVEMAESMATPGYVEVLLTVSICFEYPARRAYLKISIQKLRKPVV